MPEETWRAVPPSAGITFQALQYEGAKLAVETAMARGVGRFVLMSANGVKPHGTAYQETKYLAERFLAQSGLDYTIFRPSVVFGDPRGLMEFCTQPPSVAARLSSPSPPVSSAPPPPRWTGSSRFPSPVTSWTCSWRATPATPARYFPCSALSHCGSTSRTWPI